MEDEEVYRGDDIEDGEEQWDKDYTPWKEHIVFLVDASGDMLRACGITDAPGVSPKASWLSLAVAIFRETLKAHIVSNSRDSLALVFYGTAQKQNELNVDNVYVFTGLDEPSAALIKACDALQGDFGARIGHQGRPEPQALVHGLWVAAEFFNAQQGKALRRLEVLTCCPNPAAAAPGIMDQVHTRVDGLRAARVDLRVLPMAPAGEVMDLTFWQELLRRSSSPEGGPEGGPEGAGEEDDKEALHYGEDTIYQFDSLWSVVRRKAYRKRAMGRLPWHLGLGTHLRVSLYVLLQTAAKPPHTSLDRETNEPLKKETRLIDTATGATMTEQRYLRFPKPRGQGQPARFSPQVLFTKDALAEVKDLKTPGLRLLGFKPLALLQRRHQQRNATFVFPDERSGPGSTRLFAALLAVMHGQGEFALCSFVRNRNSQAVLVALAAQQEERTSDGQQLKPPGMHLIYLPWAHEERRWDPNFTGTEPHEPSAAQLGVMGALVDALQLPEAPLPPEEEEQDLQHYFRGCFPNPKLQQHYAVLEALALGETPPATYDDALLRPRAAVMQKLAGPLFQEALDALYEGVDQAAAEAKRATGAKRAAGGGAVHHPDGSINFEETAAKGELAGLTADQLKLYLTAHGLKKGGKKAELVGRVLDHIGERGDGPQGQGQGQGQGAGKRPKEEEEDVLWLD